MKINFSSHRLFLHLILLIGISLALLSCKDPRKGALSDQEKSKLETLAEQGIAPEEKYQQMIELYTILLEEALSKETDEAMLRHLEDFYAKNEAALWNLKDQIRGWQKSMDQEERMFMFMRLSAKSYTQKLARLDRLYHKRMKQGKRYQNAFNNVFQVVEFKR
ncbi:MAG: hypothetical protein AAGI38_11565 [Bacteroidota bacterium]